MPTTAGSIIAGALKRISSYMSGEPLAAVDANDALETLNDLLDSLSTDKTYIFASVETIVNFTGNQYQYTIGPGGNFATDIVTGAAIPRPLRITNGFTRISQIDWPIDVYMDQNMYTQIGLKNVPAPWPIAMWYNPTFPLGTLSFYPNPSSSAELHLFVDQILTELPLLTTVVSLPQGYNRALKWLLAREICTEYGFTLNGDIPKGIKDLAKEATDMIKRLNEVPAQVANYDSALLSMSKRANASWILSGGFRP